jgi:hypothetical protein
MKVCKITREKVYLYTEGYYCDFCQEENNQPCGVEDDEMEK